MIKVHCVSQEYWYIRKQRCECGGEYELLMQKLASQEGTPADVHSASCKKCGTCRDFVFDISSFYNPFRSFEDLAKVEALLKKVYPEGEVSMRMASPMEATLMYLNQLSESDDRMALEYIADAAQYALQKAGNK